MSSLSEAEATTLLLQNQAIRQDDHQY